MIKGVTIFLGSIVDTEPLMDYYWTYSSVELLLCSFTCQLCYYRGTETEGETQEKKTITVFNPLFSSHYFPKEGKKKTQEIILQSEIQTIHSLGKGQKLKKVQHRIHTFNPLFSSHYFPKLELVTILIN